MKATSKIITAAVVALGVSGLSAPAFAIADDYGQFAYTTESQSRTSPSGLSSAAIKALNPRVSQSDNGRDRVYSAVDSEHKAY